MSKKKTNIENIPNLCKELNIKPAIAYIYTNAKTKHFYKQIMNCLSIKGNVEFVNASKEDFINFLITNKSDLEKKYEWAKNITKLQKDKNLNKLLNETTIRDIFPDFVNQIFINKIEEIEKSKIPKKKEEEPTENFLETIQFDNFLNDIFLEKYKFQTQNTNFIILIEDILDLENIFKNSKNLFRLKKEKKDSICQVLSQIDLLIPLNNFVFRKRKDFEHIETISPQTKEIDWKNIQTDLIEFQINDSWIQVNHQKQISHLIRKSKKKFKFLKDFINKINCAYKDSNIFYIPVDFYTEGEMKEIHQIVYARKLFKNIKKGYEISEQYNFWKKQIKLKNLKKKKCLNKVQLQQNINDFFKKNKKSNLIDSMINCMNYCLSKKKSKVCNTSVKQNIIEKFETILFNKKTNQNSQITKNESKNLNHSKDIEEHLKYLKFPILKQPFSDKSYFQKV